MSLVDGPQAIPGFVDLQVNGYAGHDFSALSLTPEGIAEVCLGMRRAGTAGFLATLVTSSEEVYRRNLPMLAQAMRTDPRCRNLLGIHLEGPFISLEPGFVGTHAPEWVVVPDACYLERLWAWSEEKLRLITLAAEPEGAEALVRQAKALGMAVSIGHSAYDDEALRRLIAAGAEAITHFANGLPNLLPRHPNQLWSGLATEDLVVTIIADGHHLPDAVIRVVFAVKGVDRVIVVSDVSPIGGLEPGEYSFAGSRVVLEPSGAIRNVARDCLAGSAMTLMPAMNRLAAMGLLTPAELLRTGYWNPLRLIGLGLDSLPGGMEVAYFPEAGRFALHLDE